MQAEERRDVGAALISLQRIITQIERQDPRDQEAKRVGCLIDIALLLLTREETE